MSNSKRCILIQGPTHPSKNTIGKIWKGNLIIWSCWQGEEREYMGGGEVVFNTPPKTKVNHSHSLDLQRISTMNGLIRAKELGFGRVLKWRSDMIPTNPQRFLECCREDSFNIHSFHKHQMGYITDFFMEGEVDDMIRLFSFPPVKYGYPEEALTAQFFANGLDKKVHYLVEDINEENDVMWLKRNSKFSEMLSQPNYMNRIPFTKYKKDREIKDMPVFIPIGDESVMIPNNIYL